MKMDRIPYYDDFKGELETTILGGLPVLVHIYSDSYEIYSAANRSRLLWAESKIAGTRDEEAIFDAIRNEEYAT